MENEKESICGLNFLKEKLYNGVYADRLDCIDSAIYALKEVQQYRDMNRKLREEYGDCDGLLEMAVEGLCKHSCVDIGSPKKSRLLTDEDVDKWDAYREIGTVEECREAVEKWEPKECVIDSCPDHTHYKCPSCGKIHLSRYKHGFPSLGRIPRFCDHCGQAIDWEESEE